MNGFISSFLDNFYKKIYSNLNPIQVSRINIEIKSQLTNLKDSIKDIVEKLEIKNILKKSTLFISKIIQKININDNLDQFMSNLNFKENNIYLDKNILLIGKSGVGKSTLINSFLKINEAETGIGGAVTKYFIPYVSNLVPYFRLIDTKGFEGNIQQEIDNIKAYINDKLLKNKNEFIHCIWYCMTGTKYNQDDKKAIESLLKMYEYDCLPIIIVYTITVDHEEADEVLNSLKIFLGEKYYNKIDYIKVLAREKTIGIQKQKELPFGLDEIKEKTIKRMCQAKKSSYYQSIKEKIIYLYKKAIDKKYKIIKENILYKVNCTQYHSIALINFKIYFLEALKLINFNDNLEHNLEDLIRDIRINNNDNDNDNMNLLINK